MNKGESLGKISKLKNLTKLSKITGLIVLALFFYFSGYLIGHKNIVFEQSYKPKIVNMELAKPRTVNFDIFWKAWNLVMSKSVASPDSQKMIYGAISGMVQSLNDPYSVFMEPDISKSFLQDLSGGFEGIGAELSVKDQQLVIVSPISGTPADKVGLKPKDQILKINDTNVEGLSLDQAIDSIRGPAGTSVKLTIMREGFTDPQVFTIKREKITLKSVTWTMKTDRIGYIKVSQFGEDTTALMKQAANEMAVKNPQTIILDLRHNPGGYLQSAVDMVGLFVQPGTTVVKEKAKDGQVQVEKTVEKPTLQNPQLIVLIDEGSASASEIVAGALQDLNRATLVGDKSFGKGSVQDLEDLGSGASLKLTIAEWLTPKDRTINHTGIEPDVKVKISEEDYKAGLDPQLDKAMELAK